MKRLSSYWRNNARLILIGLLIVAGLWWLLVRKLGTLSGGLSAGEMQAAVQPVGWHGIFHDPLYLPLKLVRSVVFWASPGHGQLLTRLPNALFGGLSVISLSWLIWLWHGRRTAILTTLLFATSAWVLHASRLAGFDVLYLWALPTMLVIQVALHRYGRRPIVWYASLLLWGLLLYVPGLIWLVALQLILERSLLADGWRLFNSGRQRLLTVFLSLVWLPLLAIDLLRHGEAARWLGLPSHWSTAGGLLKHFAGVFVHLFIRGPQYPDIWLARAPVLDIFTLIMCGLGIYFYASHWGSSRSRSLGGLFIIGVILVAIGGPVGLSLLVPLLYIMAATGIAYLLRDWLKTFPFNPLARGLGIGLISLAVAGSCVFNLRAYFVAWPHSAATHAIFRYHR